MYNNSAFHDIPTTKDAGVINVKPYRLPYTQRQVIQEQTNKMLKEGIIEHSTSPYNSPLLVVLKKSQNGETKYRVVVDFRKLNNITIGTAYPISHITDILDQLGKWKYFSTVDFLFLLDIFTSRECLLV